jgi:hypothetical protein
MNKYINLALALVLVSTVAVARPYSIREVRDPVQLRARLNSSIQDAGSASVSSVSGTEGQTLINTTVLSLDDVGVSVIYGGGDTNAIGSTKIYDFPAGRVFVLGVTVDSFAITSFPTNTMDAADGGDFSFGSAVPGVDGLLDGTAVDFAPSTSIDPITNIVSTALAAAAQFDGTTTPVDLYVNVSIDNGDLTGASTNALTVGGTVKINWINLGDY